MIDTRTMKKGDKVYMVASWDDKGTCYYAALTVYSCGKKQFYLVTDDGKKFQNNCFEHDRPGFCAGDMVGREFVPRDGSVDIEKYTLDFAHRWKAAQLRYYQGRVDRNNEPGGEDFNGGIKFNGPILEEKKAMVPAVLNYDTRPARA